MTDGPSQILVVMPAWNEEASVSSVVADVRSHGFDVLVVDDGSTDATSELAEGAGAAILRLPVNLGVGAALRCGFRYAVAHGYDAVVQVDADGQHPAGSIVRLIEEARATKAHLLVGSRFAAEDAGMQLSRLRRVVMGMLARSASRAAGTRITDASSGFRLICEPLLSQFAGNFPAHYLGDTYEAVITAGRAGYVVREVAVTMRDRVHGTSSVSPAQATQLTLRAAIVAGARIHFPVEPAGSPGRGPGRAP